MTREEQIRKEASKYFDDYLDGLKGEVLTVDQTFEDGAKWADRHPYYNQEGYTEDMFVREQAFLDDWLDEHGAFPTFSDALEWEKKRVIDKACELLKAYMRPILEVPKITTEYHSVSINEAELRKELIINNFVYKFKRALEE